MKQQCINSDEPGQQPILVALSAIKDGTFNVTDDKDVKSARKILFGKTMYKIAYREVVKGMSILGFFARGIKTYDNSLLVFAITADTAHMFVYKCPSDPSSAPKIMDVDVDNTRWSAVKSVMPFARQVLFTEDTLVFLTSKTSIGATVRKKSAQ